MVDLMAKFRRGEKITLTDKINSLETIAEWQGFVGGLRMQSRNLTADEQAALARRRCELGGAK
ncbi:hypothetical protein [Pacificoceanicola onchidii]|uniref:hypothetical protein n=1 Tax=Pacificoceanicola onchidii TaxID=2562685 RepID=UPI0010A49EEA|nr:hypothetical protein [Pacificoceanicola onchidii]